MPDTHLLDLAEELHERGWRTDLTRDRLRVTNPDAPMMNEDVICEDGVFQWRHGPGIGPVDDLPQAVDRIMHVLRTVVS